MPIVASRQLAKPHTCRTTPQTGISSRPQDDARFPWTIYQNDCFEEFVEKLL
jgi:hypothetical protein